MDERRRAGAQKREKKVKTRNAAGVPAHSEIPNLVHAGGVWVGRASNRTRRHLNRYEEPCLHAKINRRISCTPISTATWSRTVEEEKRKRRTKDNRLPPAGLEPATSRSPGHRVEV